MNTSDQINELAKALSAAQGEMPNALLNKENPFFKSKYATLAAIRDAAVPHLSKHGLSIVQVPEVVQAGMLLVTRLLHASGQWLEGNFPIAADFAKPQAVGSAMTFARRYSYLAIIGLATEEDDDDANAAMESAKSNGNGHVKRPPTDPQLVYERLINTMRATKTLDTLAAWKERTMVEVNTLPPEWYDRLIGMYGEHKAKLPKPQKLSEQAIQSDKPPLPDDEVRYET